MSEPTNNTTPTPALEATPEKTFTQAELDGIVSERLAKAMKGMPGEEELTAFRAWKDSQQSEQERWDTLTRERDTARTDLAAAQTELEQLRRERFLLGKGIPVDDVDYYAFKIGKLVTDAMDFETAAGQFLKDHAPQADHQPSGGVRVDFTAPLGGGIAPASLNEKINNRLRGK